jgi:hypothetical protein
MRLIHRRFATHVTACVLSQLLFLLPLPTPMRGQDQTSAVPRLVSYSGVLKDVNGHAVTGLAGATFLIYKDQEGGAPLWLETQSVHPDTSGRYTVQLGTASAHGLPSEVFASGEGRWLAVQIGHEAEQPRVLLVAVPYAMKAADAETLGGLPASAFVLAAPASAAPASSNAAPTSNTAPPPNAAVTGLGTVNIVPLWDATNDIVNSAISQTGSGATAKVGINTTAPTVTLDVKGASTIRGPLTMPTSGTATAITGKNSQPFNLSGSAFNSGTAAAANQTFRLQTEPVGNNSATPSGKLSLLYYAGANPPTETGLSIASNGQITFAAGQTFPGAGGGSLTGVTAGTALTGGGTTGNVTLNLDTTKVPLLNTANLFTADQGVTGNLTASGTVTGSIVNASGSFALGNRTFAFGALGLGNVFLGFSGNFTTTGANNTAIGASAFNQNSSGSSDTATGAYALDSNTMGAQNTATGFNSLIANTSGGNNTAVGVSALSTNTTGGNNTALGYNAGPDSSSSNLSNATAIGANAVVSASNALALGGTGANAVSVGIGTAVPTATLDVRGTGKFTGLVTFAAGQTFPGTGTITGVTAGTDLSGGGTTGGVTLNVDTTKVVTSVVAGTDLTGGGTGGVQTLNLDTTKVPQLTTANTFTGDQTVFGNLSSSAVVSAGSYTLGGGLLAYGSASSDDVFLGFAGNSTVAGSFNTGVGALALSGGVTGSYNTALGGRALNDTVGGSHNTAVGFFALLANQGSSNNTAVGDSALWSAEGSGNTAIGTNAGQPTNGFDNTGSNNTFLGFNTTPGTQLALSNVTAVGANAEVDISNAIVLGSINGVNGATANTNVGIGITAPAFKLHVGIGGNGFRVEGPGTANSGLAAATFGGYGDFGIDAFGTGSGRFVVKESGLVGVGVASPTHIFQVGQGKGAAFADSWSTYSSRRWKTNIQTLPNALAKVEQMRGVSYDLQGSGKHEIGVIAEEVGQVVPEVVSFEANGKDAQGVDYSRLTAVLIEAVKEQQRQIQEQSRQIRTQQRQIARLNGKVGLLESGLVRKAASTRKKLQPAPRPTAAISTARTN